MGLYKKRWPTIHIVLPRKMIDITLWYGSPSIAN